MTTPTVALAPLPRLRFVDNNGNALSGGKLFTYVAGSSPSTKQATYVDSTGATPNTNPIILNSRGECDVWLDVTKSYKFTLSPPTDTDPPTNSFWTVDNIVVPNPNVEVGDSQGTDITLAATLVIPDTGNFFNVIAGYDTVTALSSGSTNGRRVSLQFLVAASFVSSSVLQLKDSMNYTFQIGDVLTLRAVSTGWIEESRKDTPTNILAAANIALAAFAR